MLAEDLDYHVVRASMVIMFFFIGYQKWFPDEFERLVPFISNGPLIWLAISAVRPRRRELLPRRLGMDVRNAAARRLLG
jgi:hypothetical protein